MHCDWATCQLLKEIKDKYVIGETFILWISREDNTIVENPVGYSSIFILHI